MYNEQGFLMQRLDPKDPGLFHIEGGTDGASTCWDTGVTSFRTYQQEHRRVKDRYPVGRPRMA
jgi:hypothetical protein